MKKYVISFLRKASTFMELFISLMLGVGILLLALRVAGTLVNIPDLDLYPNYNDLVDVCFNLIIGVELIRMLYQHSPSTVIEVLLFAIARQIIIDHTSAINSLIGVLAIAALFATRKFLFCEFDESEKVIFRATSKVRHVNNIIHTHIPYEFNETLGDVIKRKLEADNTEIGVGACTYFSNFGLRVAKMRDGEITRVEVIHSIR